MCGVYGKTLDLLALLTRCFVFPKEENKTQGFILELHMDVLKEDLVYGWGKSLIHHLRCLFSEGITQHLWNIFQVLSS